MKGGREKGKIISLLYWGDNLNRKLTVGERTVGGGPKKKGGRERGSN